MSGAIAAAWLNVLSTHSLRARSSAATLEKAQDGLLEVNGFHLPPLAPGEAIAAQATVQGTQLYSTRICITRNGALAGHCTCPLAADGYFCEHQVALGIILRHIVANQPMPWLAAAEAAQDPANPDAALSTHAFVSIQPQEVLVAKLWQWAQSIPQLMTALDVWAQQSQQALPGAANQTPAPASLPAVSKLKRQISDSVAEVYRNVQDGYDRNPDLSALEALLDQLQTLRDQPVVLRDLCAHAWEEMADCYDEILDDECETDGLFDRLLDLLHQTLRDAPPTADWFDTWMQLMDNDPAGLWDEADTLAVAGPAVQARYIEMASHDWQQWLSDMANRGASALQRDLVRERYLRALALQGDVAAQIDTMRQHLAHVHEYLALADCLIQQGRTDEAITHLETAHGLHPNQWDIEGRLLAHYDRTGRHTDALALRRQQLARHPSSENYLATLRSAVAAGHDEATYRAELHAWAATREAPATRVHAKSWDDHRTHLRIRWWLAENQPVTAWALLDTPATCSTDLLEALALALPASHHAPAVVLLRHLFERHMPQDSSPYTKTLQWVAQAGQRMHPAERTGWLHQLRLTYKPKRNFIKGLNEMHWPA
jgi:tetratricopeptide (TPR) repeat protein